MSNVGSDTVNATYARIIIWNTSKIHPLATEVMNTPRRRVYEPCLVYIDDYPTTFQRASRSPPRRPSGNTAFATRRPSRPASIMHALHYSAVTFSDWKQIKEIIIRPSWEENHHKRRNMCHYRTDCAFYTRSACPRTRARRPMTARDWSPRGGGGSTANHGKVVIANYIRNETIHECDT